MRLAWLVLLLVAWAVACSEHEPTIGPGTSTVQIGDDGPSVSIDSSNEGRQDTLTVPAGIVTSTTLANSAFAVEVFSLLRTGDTGAGAGNLILSPLSASFALTMAYAGARGTTATQMAAALQATSLGPTVFQGHNVLSQDLAKRGYAALTGDQTTAAANDEPIPSASDYHVDVVSEVWGQVSYPWASPFLAVLAEDYGTGVYLADFAGASEEARATLDAWVSEATSDTIENLLPSTAVDASTRMVLVGAMHVELPWLTPFQPAQTAPSTFTRADGTVVSTPMMRQTLDAYYTDDGQAQILGLPLAGQDEAVVIALPRGSLAAYEASLTATSLALVRPPAKASVDLALPKLSFTSASFSLKTVLQAMGMTDAFEATTADFSGMCPSTPDGTRLYVEDVLEKTFLSMEETGLEAAGPTVGTTGADGGAGGPGRVVVPMTVDRPFLITVVDVPTGAVLLLGHVEDPSEP